MFSSPRKSASLKMFETLEGRYELPPKERTAFKRLQQGYEGEKRFSELLSARVRKHCIPIFDLGLKPNGNECQLDALLIFQTVIYHLEIKTSRAITTTPKTIDGFSAITKKFKTPSTNYPEAN